MAVSCSSIRVEREMLKEMPALFLLVLAHAAILNEALALDGHASDQELRHDSISVVAAQEVSKADIMATMTVEKAYRTFLNMNHSKLDESVVSMIKQKLGGSGKQHSEPGLAAAYSPVDTADVIEPNEADEIIDDFLNAIELNTARDMLNSMMFEATMNKELEAVRCYENEVKQLKMISPIERDITYANAEAAAAKSETLRASEMIQKICSCRRIEMSW